MNFKKSWKRANDGFTLVELIVVIAILAILAGIAVPAYSGYIKKANKAADLQLLAAVNTAYAAAVMENDVATDIKTVGGSITLGGPQGAMYIASVRPEKYSNSFNTYYAGNTNSTFKVITKLVFENGAFVDAADSGNYTSTTYKGNTVYVNQAQLSTLTDSTLGDLGAKTLLTEVGKAVDTANSLNLTEKAGDAFYAAYYDYLGVDTSKYDLDDPDQAAQAQAEIDAAIDKLGGDSDAIAANAVALYAAQNSTNLTTDSISKWLGTGSDDTDVFYDKANASTLSEAAAIYGLYLSYAESEGQKLPETPLEVVGAALGSNDFATWVSTNSDAQSELEAYKAAMSIINDAAADDNTRGELLQNGFADEKLIEAMAGLMGK